MATNSEKVQTFLEQFQQLESELVKDFQYNKKVKKEIDTIQNSILRLRKYYLDNRLFSERIPSPPQPPKHRIIREGKNPPKPPKNTRE